MPKRARRSSAFTLVELMIVVGTIGLLAAIVVPNYIKAATVSRQRTCINNLRQIDSAVQQWAIDQKVNGTVAISATNILSYLKNSVVCPAGGTTFDDSYFVANTATPAVCLIVPATHKLP